MLQAADMGRLMPFNDTLSRLVIATLGADAGMEILDTLTIDPAVTGDGDVVSRSTVAMALNAVLMHGLLERVPTGAEYVADRRRAGRRILDAANPASEG